jgi:hypothetical protein
VAQVDANGKEVARFPDPVANQANQPPLDGPIDMAYHGNSLLVANSAYLSNTPANWALVDIFVGEPGLSTAQRPSIPTPGGYRELAIRVSPRKIRAGRRTRLHFKVTSNGDPVKGATVRVGRKRTRTNARGRGSLSVVVRKRGRHDATVRKPGYRPAHATFTVR